MPESFTTIRIESFDGSAWYNLTPDVRQNPPPRVSGMGGLGFDILDRIGGAATFNFTLDNSAANSAGTLGYYTPAGVNGGDKISPGSPVRIYFEYDGRRRYKFYGTVDMDGMQVAPGQYLSRTVSVRCSNWLARAAEHKLDLLGYKTNQTFDTAFRFVLGNMAHQPQNILFYTGQQIFPTVFDITRTNTTALGELNKLVYSEWGRAYIKGDDTSGETLVLEDFNWWSRQSDTTNGSHIPKKQSDVTSVLTLMTGSNLTLMTGSTLLLNEYQEAEFVAGDVEDMQQSYGAHVHERVTFKTYPRKIVTSQVLWSLPASEPIELTAGLQLTDVRGTYTDPNGGFAKVNGLDDTMSTTYAAFQNADGTGTDYTSSVSVVAKYGTAEVDYTITNNAAATVYLTQLDATGSAVLIYDTNDKTYSKGTRNPVEIDLPYLANINGLLYLGYYDTIWDGTLYYANIEQPTTTNLTMTVNKTSKQMMAFMFLEPRDWIIYTEAMTNRTGVGGYTSPWFIQSYDFEIINGTTVKWYLNLKFTGVA